MQVTVYTKPGCHLCDDALDLLDRLTPQYGLDVRQVNILEDMAFYEAYHAQIPVIEVSDGKFGRLVAPIDEPELRAYLEMARRESLPTPPVPARPSVLPENAREPFVDRIAGSIGRHWLRWVCMALAIFVGIPWLAPVFAAQGWLGVSDPIYTAYALTCHQLPERAGYVFGYQVAFCYRNTALYLGIAFFGVLFGLARDHDVAWLRWLKRPAPWYVFVLLLLPMIIDGGSHMLGLRDTMPDMVEPTFNSFYIGSQIWSLNWWLRVLTGATAALGAVWFAFPRMERAMLEAETLRQMYKQAALRRQQRAMQQSVQ
ncbi:MAG TPA: DUF2085 domain-containing protein [Chloroflexia bacterium]|jgi:uncharacterized membrane protein/glutaredoxin